jgi:RimJ/RimL family protein N-acetyltransferase
MAHLRVLEESDASLLDTFLRSHRDTSMFLRSNARRSGLAYRPRRFHALYAGAFQDGQLVGVAAHCWNGMLLVQAPEFLEELAPSVIKWSGRRVTGFSGPLDQVRRARIALALADAPATMDTDEALYGLDLTDVVIPRPLRDGAVVCRAPLPEERDTLCAWRLAYEIETLGATDSVESRERAAEVLDAQIADANVWVAVDQGRLVSLSAFNAALPDIVQLGGIYTPPESRGRGYAKAAVAASLLAARDRGATRAVLFTDNPSAARSYEAVGFRRLGDYGLILLS